MKKLNVSIPKFYNLANAADYKYESPFVSDFNALTNQANEFARQYGIKPVGAPQQKNVIFLGIDLQKSFCFPEGTLFVGGRSGDGAIQDSKRISEFIYRNIDVIKEIRLTLDTHFLYQIFFPTFWLDKNGNNPPSNTPISTDDIKSGKLRPDPKIASWLVNGNYSWLLNQVKFYTQELEKAKKYQLWLWPPHTLLGSQGHNLVGVVQEAAFFHGAVRGNQPGYEIKGGNPFTENYSILSPEVLLTWDGHPLDQKNTEFIKTLLSADYLIIAGQAASHCVKSSIDDLFIEIAAQNPALMKKVYILEDCMSSVAIPDGKGGFYLDCTDNAKEALDKFANAGMNIVKSTEPIDSWKGLVL